MTNYPTNLGDSQWSKISIFFDIKRRRKYDLREIINAILYLLKTGCQWRMLPGDFPHWKIVYYYFSTWKKNGIWSEMQQYLVEEVRIKEQQNVEPSIGIIDSQSVKNTLVSCEDKGFDAGKKIKGIKRHIIVDKLGLIIAIVIHSAGIQDRDGAISAIKTMKENWSRVIKIFADGGYAGKLIQKIKELFNLELEIVKRNNLKEFKVLPKRWIVERTFSWIDTFRRTSKNYERLNDTSLLLSKLLP